MIIWRGWGVLVAAIVFGTSLAANLLAEAFGGKRYWETHAWPFGSAMIAAGVFICVADFVLSKRPTQRSLIDEATGERFVMSNPHTFFFLRMRWWGLAVAAFGVFVLIDKLAPG